MVLTEKTDKLVLTDIPHTLPMPQVLTAHKASQRLTSMVLHTLERTETRTQPTVRTIETTHGLDGKVIRATASLRHPLTPIAMPLVIAVSHLRPLGGAAQSRQRLSRTSGCGLRLLSIGATIVRRFFIQLSETRMTELTDCHRHTSISVTQWLT